MKRKTVDQLISSLAVVLAVVLFATAGALFWAHNFIHTQVEQQLTAQQISFPVAGSESLNALPEADRLKVEEYAGQQLTNGAQAKVFADNYIAVHLVKAGNGATYAQLSSASMADPTNTKLAGQVQVVFRGETLRGLLLNAYAFDTMATVAAYAAFGSLIAGIVLLILAALGFQHSTKTTKKRR